MSHMQLVQGHLRKRVENSSPTTPRFRPMMTEWKIIPNSRTRKATICWAKDRRSAVDDFIFEEVELLLWRLVVSFRCW